MQKSGLPGLGNAAVEKTREMSWPRLLVRVPISRTVGASTSPRMANTWLRPSAVSARSLAQSKTGCSGPR